MKILARPLHDHAVTIVPAPVRRAWPRGGARLFEDPTLQAATSRGWDLLCPYEFEAVWDGGDGPDAISITAPGFARSHIGAGVLSFATGYELELDAGHDLWIRGPINQHKDGLQPIDQVVEADLLPYAGDVHWRFTRPHQIVRFERGEPFATLLPYPAHYIEGFVGEVAAVVNPPGVTCVCPTYGRPSLLEEAIESFLRQDYAGPKELLVLNDCPEQQLVLTVEHPEVRIVNLPARFRTLGEKLNAGVGLAAYNLLFPWLDDDISLPHRLSFSLARFDAARGFFKARTAFYWNDHQVSGPEHNVFHGGSCYSRELFVRVGGYPAQSGAVDQAFEAAVARARLDAAESTEIEPAENYYVYRWRGTGSFHLSAPGGNDEDGEGGYAAAAAHVGAELAAGRLPRGPVRLRPAWRQDYNKLTRTYLADLAAQSLCSLEGEPVPLEAPAIAFGRLPRPVPNDEATLLFRETSPLRLSVVLPSCNEAAYLQRTVEQFRATLPARSEIVVVDNGSTDGSSDFLLNGTAQPVDGQPHLVEAGEGADGVAICLARHPEPLGVAGARNRGLELSRGEVIVFADAHVDVPPGWWAPLVATLNRPGVGIAGPSFSMIGATNQGTGHGQRIADSKLRLEWLPGRGEEPYPVPTLGGGFLAMRREVVEVSGGFDGSMRQWGSEDLELCLRLWLFGYEVWVVPEVEIPHYFRKRSPYEVDWKHAISNLIRTAFLHLNEERLARFLHAMSDHPQYARALALCVESDVWARRHELRRRRVHDDDWFFRRPYFADIEMELRHVTPA